MEITVRYADRAELPRVNELRKMVNELHANGRPDIFRPGFCAELQQHVYQKFDSDAADVIVALADGVVCGFAIAEYIDRPESLLSHRGIWRGRGLPPPGRCDRAHRLLPSGGHADAL